MNTKNIFTRFFLCFSIFTLIFPYGLVTAAELGSASDVLSSQKIGAASNHTISFRATNGVAAGTMKLYLGNLVSSMSSLTVSDVSLSYGATTAILAETRGVDNTWGLAFNTTSKIVTFTYPTSGTPIPAGQTVTIKIGRNVSGGAHQMTNVSTEGTKLISFVTGPAGIPDVGLVAVALTSSDYSDGAVVGGTSPEIIPAAQGAITTAPSAPPPATVPANTTPPPSAAAQPPTSDDKTPPPANQKTEQPETTLPPTTKATLSGILGTQGWYKGGVTITLSATSEKGQLEASYYLKGTTGTFIQYQTPFIVSAEGETTITYYSKDTKGNEEVKKTLSVKIDRTSPKITPGPEKIFDTTQIETLEATATDDISGVTSVTWAKASGPGVLNFDAPTALKTHVDADKAGNYTVRFTATDGAGNISSSVVALTVKEPPAIPLPSTSVSLTGVLGGEEWYRGSVTIGLSAVPGSDRTTVSKIFYRLGEAGAFREYEKSFTLTQEGVTSFYYYALDSNGRKEEQNATTIKIDTTAPDGAVTINPGTPSVNTQLISLSLACRDQGAGCARMRFSNDGVTWQALQEYGVSLPWTLSGGDGEKIIFAQFFDKAGNTSTILTGRVILDTTPPEVSIAALAGVAKKNEPVTLLGNVTDSSSLGSVQWVKASGPGGITFSSGDLLETKAIADLPGRYTLRLRVSDKDGNTSFIDKVLVVQDPVAVPAQSAAATSTNEKNNLAPQDSPIITFGSEVMKNIAAVFVGDVDKETQSAPVAPARNFNRKNAVVVSAPKPKKEEIDPTAGGSIHMVSEQGTGLDIGVPPKNPAPVALPVEFSKEQRAKIRESATSVDAAARDVVTNSQSFEKTTARLEVVLQQTQTKLADKEQKDAELFIKKSKEVTDNILAASDTIAKQAQVLKQESEQLLARSKEAPQKATIESAMSQTAKALKSAKTYLSQLEEVTQSFEKSVTTFSESRTQEERKSIEQVVRESKNRTQEAQKLVETLVQKVGIMEDNSVSLKPLFAIVSSGSASQQAAVPSPSIPLQPSTTVVRSSREKKVLLSMPGNAAESTNQLPIGANQNQVGGLSSTPQSSGETLTVDAAQPIVFHAQAQTANGITAYLGTNAILENKPEHKQTLDGVGPFYKVDAVQEHATSTPVGLKKEKPSHALFSAIEKFFGKILSVFSPAVFAQTLSQPSQQNISEFPSYQAEVPVVNFDPSLVYTFHYSDKEVANVDESTLALYSWDIVKDEWVKESSTVNTTDNTVIATIPHLSIFHLFGEVLGIPPDQKKDIIIAPSAAVDIIQSEISDHDLGLQQTSTEEALPIANKKFYTAGNVELGLCLSGKLFKKSVKKIMLSIGSSHFPLKYNKKRDCFAGTAKTPHQQGSQNVILKVIYTDDQVQTVKLETVVTSDLQAALLPVLVPALQAVRETAIVVNKGVEKTVVTTKPVLQATAIATVPVVTVINPVVLTNSINWLNYLGHFFTWLLSLLGIRRRRKTWGVVYHAIAKTPIDLAIVRLFAVDSKKLVETQVTDKQGRFSFLAQPGDYTVSVTKPPLLFPSTIVTSSVDGEYSNVYRESVITIKSAEDSITLSIPLDPEPATRGTSHAQEPFAKRLTNMVTKYSSAWLVISFVMSILLAIYTPSKVNTALLAINWIYSTIQILLMIKPEKPWGTVFDVVSMQPIPLAAISIFDAKQHKLLRTRLTDYTGRFNFLAPQGEYQITVTKQQYVFPPPQKPHTTHFRHVYMGEEMRVKRTNAIVKLNIPMQPTNQEAERAKTAAAQAAEAPSLSQEKKRGGTEGGT